MFVTEEKRWLVSEITLLGSSMPLRSFCRLPSWQGDMVEHEGRLSLREVPAMAYNRHRQVCHGVIHSGIRGCMLQGLMGTVGVSVLHVFNGYCGCI